MSPELCLDYHAGANVTKKESPLAWREPPRAGEEGGVAHCYPSANPLTNRDPAQQWVWEKDSTVRPAADKRLCLTTRVLEDDPIIRLETCDGRAEQHWSYDGPAPGGGNGGSVSFGVTAIGIIHNKAS